ncbi:MAG: alpha/beta hydrolase, partial [Acidobacteriota bacterium]|nr:alpha/beta hydrolase [Acidobacteriota bacterium]
MNKQTVRRPLIGNFTLSRFMRSLILITILIYLGITFYAYLISERVIFQPQRSSYQDTKQIRKLKTADGAIISALYLPNQSASHTVLFSHGNAEDLGTLSMFLEELRSMGFAVFAYDYHGYGTSTGLPSESHAYLD